MSSKPVRNEGQSGAAQDAMRLLKAQQDQAAKKPFPIGGAEWSERRAQQLSGQLYESEAPKGEVPKQGSSLLKLLKRRDSNVTASPSANLVSKDGLSMLTRFSSRPDYYKYFSAPSELPLDLRNAPVGALGELRAELPKIDNKYGLKEFDAYVAQLDGGPEMIEELKRFDKEIQYEIEGALIPESSGFTRWSYKIFLEGGAKDKGILGEFNNRRPAPGPEMQEMIDKIVMSQRLNARYLLFMQWKFDYRWMGLVSNLMQRRNEAIKNAIRTWQD